LVGPFAILCCSALAFFMCVMMFLAALPVHAAERLQMTQAQIGLIIAAFALLAMLCKPHAGWALDVLGRRPVLLAGAAIFLVASLLYTVAGGVATLLLVRGFHGIGMGLFPTAGAAVVADLAPPNRRGEGMGYFSATGSFAMAVGPVLGMALANGFSFSIMCFVAAAFALASLVWAWHLPETGKRVAAPPPPLTVDGLFSRRAMLPSAVLLCLFLGYGGIMAFFPLLARETDLKNPGWFFTVMAAVILVLRARGGTLSDRFGRVRVIAPSLVCAGVAVAALGFLRSATAVVAAGIAFAAGFGMATPALMAMATDGVPPEERGRAMGTLQTAWELGIAGGAVGVGQILSWSGGHFGLAFAVAGAASLGGAALALAARRRVLRD
jgi:predicted MFS family arabinose efflux permease